MARSIPNKLLHDHHLHQIISNLLPPWLSTLSVAAVFLGIVSVFSVVMFLCGSGHGQQKRNIMMIRSKRDIRLPEMKTERLGDQNDQRVLLFARLHSSVSEKAFLLKSKTMRMLSWKKNNIAVQQQEEEQEYYCDDDEGAIWKKTIIKGEKCRPLNFSGEILYYSDGNRLPDSPTQPR